MKEKEIALIGIGNVLRGDDGLGNYIVEKIEQLHIKNVRTIIVHQLHVELLEELKDFDSIIFVDASLKSDEFIFEEIKSNSSAPLSSSHRINAEMFVQLARKLYQSNTRFYSCAIKGYDFDMGENLSPQAKSNTEKAIEQLTCFIKSQISNPKL